jgi:arginyl-tRNA synthetase
MRKALFFALLIALIVSVGCVEKPEKPDNGEAEPFVPPADGKITGGQKDCYIKASIGLKAAMDTYSNKIKEFVDTYEVNPDLTQMADSAFLAEHPEIKKAWDALTEEWLKMQEEAYKNAGISEDEFNWIGGALTDSINTDIQKEVEKELSPTMEPEKKGEG